MSKKLMAGASMDESRERKESGDRFEPFTEPVCQQAGQRDPQAGLLRDAIRCQVSGHGIRASECIDADVADLSHRVGKRLDGNADGVDR